MAARVVVVAVVATAGVLLGAAPAAPPDYPVNFIHVDELKAQLDRGVKGDLIDVRNWQAYVEQHLPGARSMPLRVVEQRSGEISRKGLVVFY
jgi:hypothetical protein